MDGNVVTIGITQYAADELTDITYVELPEVNTMVIAGHAFGEIESVKATAELTCGVGGKVIEVNERLADEPELVNNDPYGDGWMIRVEVPGSEEFEKLLSPTEYAKIISG
jgi:glycine cleavage system H protein